MLPTEVVATLTLFNILLVTPGAGLLFHLASLRYTLKDMESLSSKQPLFLLAQTALEKMCLKRPIIYSPILPERSVLRR